MSVTHRFLSALIIAALSLTPAFGANFTKHKIGDFTFISFNDRRMEPDVALFKSSDMDKMKKELEATNAREGGLNYFLLDTGSQKILFDAGLNDGTVVTRLAEAGIKPEDINMICLTHMHGDHIGGMLDQSEKAVFPNATVHVAAEEAAYWQGRNQAADKTMEVYKDKLKTFSQNSEILPGVQSIPAFGHTPGHTLFKITDDGKSVLIWGDLVHARVQFADPDIYLVYDTTPEEAIQTRKKVLQMVVDEGLTFAGMHVPAPGTGKLAKDGTGYRFTTGF